MDVNKRLQWSDRLDTVMHFYEFPKHDDSTNNSYK